MEDWNEEVGLNKHHFDYVFPFRLDMLKVISTRCTKSSRCLYVSGIQDNSKVSDSQAV